MESLNSSKFRQELPRLLKKATQKKPIRIHHKDGDAVLISYEEYLRLKKSKSDSKKPTKKLKPLLKGKILKTLGEEADQELLEYMGTTLIERRFWP